MKLLMVTRESESDKRYGLGRSLLPVIDALSARGHEVTYVCRSARGQRSERMTRLAVRLLTPLARVVGGRDSDSEAVLGALLERMDMGRLACKIARRDGHTHVHLHDPWMAMGFVVAQRFTGGARRCRWGITEHGYGCYGHAVHEDGGRQSTRLGRIMRRLERHVVLAADWVMSPTHAALRELARDLVIHPTPAHWHAIAHPLPTLNAYGRAEARVRLGWPEEDLFILGVGRLATLKRFDLLVRAVSRLRSNKALRLVILGEGDTEGMQSLALACGLSHPILFAVTDDVGLYLSATDLYVSTSSTESFGLANLEALAIGARTICTAVGGVPEVVGSGATLVALDVDAITSAIQQAADDLADRCSWRDRALGRAAMWPGPEEIAARYLEAYGEAIADEAVA